MMPDTVRGYCGMCEKIAQVFPVWLWYRVGDPKPAEPCAVHSDYRGCQLQLVKVFRCQVCPWVFKAKEVL
jgi:hypothetical protein